VHQYAPLVARGIDLTKPLRGWKIEFTWFGLPKKWTPLHSVDARAPKLKLISYRKSLQANAILRDVLKTEKGVVAIGFRTINVLKKMGFDVF
jgi:hypothetical protein